MILGAGPGLPAFPTPEFAFSVIREICRKVESLCTVDRILFKLLEYRTTRAPMAASAGHK
jgi:hypothetical protein